MDYDDVADEPWYPQAMAILEAMVVNDMPRLFSQFEELSALYGWEGINRSMQIWADMALEASGIPEDAHEHIIALGFVDESGAIRSADEVEPMAAWCGRLLAARAADDAEQWAALIMTAQERGALMVHLVTFLQGTARTLLAYFERKVRGDLDGGA
jgi:hypothetical protein